MNKLIYILFVIIALSGCSPENNTTVNNADLDTQVSDLQSQVNVLNNQMTQLLATTAQLQEYNNKMPKLVATFTPSDVGGGHYTVLTNDGYFFIKLDSLTKYANGYRVNFGIGNPNSAIYNGMKIKLSWGEAYSKDKNINDWNASLKSEELEINKPILPGVWNTVSIILSPAQPKDTGIISVLLTPNYIQLSPDYRTNMG